MKKTVILSLLLLTGVSCNTLSVLNNDVSTLRTASVNFDNRNYIIISTDIEDVKDAKFFFDTGAEGMAVLTDTIYKDVPKNRKASFGKIQTPDGKKSAKTIYLSRVQTPWFHSESKAVNHFLTPKAECGTPSPIFGIIGMDAFVDNQAVLELDFVKNQINSFKKEEFDKERLSKFVKVRSEFKRRQIFVYAICNGKEERLLFDTGNNGGIIVPYDKTQIEQTPNRMEIEGVSAQSLSGAFGTNTAILNTYKLGFMGEEFDTTVMMMHGYPLANMGIRFISRFNWIINFGTKEIYASKNDNPDSPIYSTSSYMAMVLKGKLLIASRLKDATDYALGHEIISVSDQEVTPENLCEQYLKLNTTPDWKSLNVITRPPKE